MNNGYVERDDSNDEGLLNEFLGRMPWYNAEACRNIALRFPGEVERNLILRAERLARQDREAEQSEQDEIDF